MLDTALVQAGMANTPLFIHIKLEQQIFLCTCHQSQQHVKWNINMLSCIISPFLYRCCSAVCIVLFSAVTCRRTALCSLRQCTSRGECASSSVCPHTPSISASGLTMRQAAAEGSAVMSRPAVCFCFSPHHLFSLLSYSLIWTKRFSPWWCRLQSTKGKVSSSVFITPMARCKNGDAEFDVPTVFQSIWATLIYCWPHLKR